MASLVAVKEGRKQSILASDLDLLSNSFLAAVHDFEERTITRRHSSLEASSSSSSSKPTLRKFIRQAQSARFIRPSFLMENDEEDEDDDDDITNNKNISKEMTPKKITKIHAKNQQEKENDFIMNASNAESTEKTNKVILSSNKNNIEKAKKQEVSLMLAISGVILGGVGANLTLERLNHQDPGCGSVVTLLQYTVAILDGLSSFAPTSWFGDGTTRMMIPFYFHISFSILLFAGSWMANKCLEYDLPFGLFLAVKNSNLVFSLLVGAIFLNKRYNARQVLAVTFVSIGVILSVLFSKTSSKQQQQQSTTMSWSTLLGVLICMGSTFSFACLSCIQEYVFGRYKRIKDGKNNKRTPTAEAMFFTHILGLPLFINPGMKSHIITLASKYKTTLPLIFLNVASMALCKSNIFRLLDISSSLTTTLAITISRFLGIVISVGLASSSSSSGENKDLGFWIGALFVIAGSLMYVFAAGNRKKKAN